MTTYSAEDLSEEWEFKIVRSALQGFGNPQTLRRLVEEEARAGWVMVEKFDNGRVRFKRRRRESSGDALLISEGIDPYRTEQGMNSPAIALVVVGLVLALGLGVAVLLFFVAS